MRRRGRVLALVGLLTMLALAPAGAQQPSDEAAELGLQVLVGHGGVRTNSRWTPVEVAIEPARLLQADLTVSTRSTSGAASEVVGIEAAARTRRVYRFLVPNGPISVRVEEPGRDPVEVRAARAEVPAGFIVGHLGGTLPEGMPSVRSEPTGLTGTWVPVAPEWLALSPESLDPLGALVATDTALRDLSAGAVASLRGAVVAGLDLVVVAEAPGALADLGLPLPADGVVAAGLPAGRALEASEQAWALRAGTLGELAELDAVAPADTEAVVAARTFAGRGTVAVTALAPGEGDLGGAPVLWSLLLGPPGHVNVRAGDWEAAVVPYQLERVFSTEQSSAPTLPWLALFTITYIVVVGPINGIVLSRLGRRELAWATIPLTTVVFTAAAFFGVSGTRPPEGLVGRVLVSLDGVGTEIVSAGVRAPTEGTRAIALDGEGWTARTLTSGGDPAVLRRTATGLQAELDLGGLQFGGLVASRPTDALPPVEIAATAGADGVVAVIRNTGAQPVTDVVVRSATSTRAVGTLAPGEEREVEVAGTSLTRVGAYRDVFQGFRSGPAAGLEALVHSRLLDGSPGTAWVVGTVAGTSDDVRVADLPPEDRGRLVVAGTSVRDDGALSPFAVRREAFSPQRRGMRVSPLAFEEMETALLRFRFPAGGSATGLRARLDSAEPGLVHTVSVYLPASARWVALDEAFPEGVGDPAELLDPLGTVWARVEGDLYPFDYSGTSIDGLTEVGR